MDKVYIIYYGNHDKEIACIFKKENDAQKFCDNMWNSYQEKYYLVEWDVE